MKIRVSKLEPGDIYIEAEVDTDDYKTETDEEQKVNRAIADINKFFQQHQIKLVSK